jgi:hypothetical protein
MAEKESDLGAFIIPASVLTLVPSAIAHEYCILPFSVTTPGTVKVFCADPFDATALQAVQFTCGILIEPVFVAREKLLPLIVKHYGDRRGIRCNRQKKGENKP